MRLADLRTNNLRAIRSAGPRYAPGLDSTAPNLAIASLNIAFETIGLTADFRSSVRKLRTEFETAWKKAPRDVVRGFRRRVHSPTLLGARLAELENAPPQVAIVVSRRTELTAKRANALVQRLIERAMSALQTAPADSDERRKRDLEYDEIRRFASALGKVLGFVRSPSAALIGKNTLLLLGGWGMGKTHSLCDLTDRRMRLRLPTLLYLAQQLPNGVNPIDGLCHVTGLSRDAERLLASLNRMGRHRQKRALLIIDAINEGDRLAWRRALPALCRNLRRYTNVGLILSCRQPFEEQIISQRTAQQFVTVQHQGFGEIEFDAQLSFFQHYNIPAPQIPLITPEYSRPLFLQLLCKAIANLSRTGKHRQIQSFASGQRGMTYLLEYSAKKIGATIERDLRLPLTTCWRILKGDPVARGGPLVGVAPLMADQLRDYVTWDECIGAIEPFVPGPRRRQAAGRLARRMLADGLLTEELRWEENGYREVIRFPYQRFGDHIIARCLLRHLNTASVSTIRRSFYRTRPLGRVFELTGSRQSFQRPGFASAIMLEFPERVKGHVPPDDIELIFYLPKTRRLVAPFKDAFLEGLPWRSANHFTRETHSIIGSMLERYGDQTRNETLEVLVGLATRPGHPCSADKLYRYLDGLQMADRDLSWTEYLRNAEDFSVVFKLLEWVERNAGKGLNADAVGATIKLLSLMLTSIHRPFRDRATRALFLIGLKHPNALFENTLSILAFNDAYVPERLLAASYGVAMSLWADPAGASMRTALTPFVRELVAKMFLPQAPSATRHVLMRDYALNLIALARRLDSGAVPRRQLRFLQPPFAHLPVQLPDPGALTQQQREETEPALKMDFDNYTLGHLIPNRQNYDSQNPDYQLARNQLLGRMSQLGYSYPRFKHLDDLIGRGNWNRSHDPNKTDRYGKKYSWIAYFELYGLRQDNGQVRERDRAFERVSDCDIDPSFPEQAAWWTPSLPDVFSRSPRGAIEWLQTGPVPRYDHLLQRTSVDSLRGPWVLLNGFIEQTAPDDPRVVFTFLRGLLIPENRLERLRQKLERTEYPGNDAIPRPYEDHYTFAGEIPWSVNFGGGLRTRQGKALRNVQSAFERWGQGRRRWGLPVEVPVHDFGWESYHSTMNQAGGPETAAPALCEALGLVNRPRRFDLFDATGRQATEYRRIGDGGTGNVLYMRRSLLRRYLRATHQKLLWVVWGERNFSGSSGMHDRADLRAAWPEYKHIHKKFIAAP